MPRRFCIEPGCTEIFDAATGSARCPAHQSVAAEAKRARDRVYDNTRRKPRGSSTQRGYGADYQRARKQLLAAAMVCHWCELPFTEGDPATADHLHPVSQGGDQTDGLVAAHRSCNSRRGGQLHRRPR